MNNNNPTPRSTRQRGGFTALFLLITALTCQAQTCMVADSCDNSFNDFSLWNDPSWWDQRNKNHNLFETPVQLSLRLDSLCPALDIRYRLLLDLDNDGSWETAVESWQSQTPGLIVFGNANSASYTDGIHILFDKRPQTDPVDRYRFALEVQHDSLGAQAVVRFNTLRNPDTYLLPILPHGRYRIQWYCGKESICTRDFVVKDCEKPTLTCKANISVSIQQNGVASIWAWDLLESASDNCSPMSLQYGISKQRPVITTPPYAPLTGQLINLISFFCCDLGEYIITLWAVDEAGNFSSCQTHVIVQSNLRCSCGPAVYGTVKTVRNKGIKGAHIQVDENPKGYTLGQITPDSTGYYEFRINPIPGPGTIRICPSFNEHPLNGITTVDLARIIKHILGVDTFQSPYTRIAADVNASGSITSFDVVELRKLILGVYDTLPNNTSWRFVRKSHVFSNPSNPFDPAFPECASFDKANFYYNVADLDFIGIKIGDVNLTAVPGLQAAVGQDRSSAALPLYLPDRAISPGDTVDLRIDAPYTLFARQFTLHTPGLEWLDLIPETGNVNAAHFAWFPESRRLTHAWSTETGQAEAVAFTLRFRAHTGGRLRDLLQLVDSPTPAIAYKAEETALPIQLHYETAMLSAEMPNLLPNQPNPFDQQTTLLFTLPEAGHFRLAIFDAKGSLCKQYEGYGERGLNQFTLHATDEWPRGLLYCRLESGTGIAGHKILRH